ncbi:hypothetical protein K3495_g12297 [Podosphaera aphanis]|nr:hypothetical protein K3495_g12297 [Podosphaera aphanis]
MPNSPSSIPISSPSTDLQLMPLNNELADQRETPNEDLSEDEADLTEHDEPYDQVMNGWDPVQQVAGVKRPHSPEDGITRSQRGRAVKRVDYY